MKIIVLENNYEKAPIDDFLSWYLIADSALTNWGKPFFLPLEMGKVEVTASIGVRISRLGKSISPKFAKRYYHEVAPILHFRFPELKEKLMKRGLSFSPAVSFDKSLFYGEFFEMPENLEQLKLEMKLNGETKVTFDVSKLNTRIDDVIAKVSEMNTLKMGDLIIPGLSKPIDIHIGDIIDLGKEFMKTLTVKVK